MALIILYSYTQNVVQVCRVCQRSQTFSHIYTYLYHLFIFFFASFSRPPHIHILYYFSCETFPNTIHELVPELYLVNFPSRRTTQTLLSHKTMLHIVGYAVPLGVFVFAYNHHYRIHAVLVLVLILVLVVLGLVLALGCWWLLQLLYKYVLK